VLEKLFEMDFTKMSVFLLILAVSGVLSVPAPAEVTPEKSGIRDARSPTPETGDLETSETFLLGGYGLWGGYGGFGGGYGLGYGYPYGIGYGLGYGGYPWGGYGFYG
jgi:hypothetical protein